MKKTLVSIEKKIDRFLLSWVHNPKDFKNLEDCVIVPREFITKELKSFLCQQILALLKELEGELPKRKSEKQTQKEVRDFHSVLQKEDRQKIRAKNYGYNSALDDIKAILQNKMKEVKS